jgi:hypothetical protein
MTTRTLLLAVHIAAVGGWLGANFVQLVLAPRFFKGPREGAIAWARQTVWLSGRYYGVVAVALVGSGVLLVLHGHWSWGSGFIWVGIGAIAAIAVTVGPFIGPAAKRRVEALETGDLATAMRAQRTKTVLDLVDTAFVLLAMVAMIAKWGV